MKRRQLLHSAMLAVPAWHAPSLFAASQDYDILIRGGRVIDPASGIDAMLDVAIRDGMIAAVDSSLPGDASQVIDAGGKLVVPGLIDVHVHARDAELPPSENLKDGVTTLVDGGSRGATNIDTILSIARAAPNRMRLLLNIGRFGNYPGGVGEFLDGIAPGDVSMCRAAIREHREWILGVKARLSRGVCNDLDQQVLKRAILAAEPYGIPVMIHIGDTATPLPQLLSLLRPGDIVTHMYAPTANGIMDENGRVLAAVRQARERGIRFDLGHGLTEHWNWATAEAGMAQDFPPDTISSDLTIAGRTSQVFNLPNVMSKFLYLGMPLDDVIACVTSNASQNYPEFSELGTLKPGSIADVAVLELVEGDYEFVDNYKGTRNGTQKLFTRAVVCKGEMVRS